MTTAPRSWLLEFLALWRPRVGMFLGDEEVRTVARFLDGYTTALEDTQSSAAADIDLLDGGFTDFLKTKFGDYNRSWDQIIEEEFQRTPDLWPSEYRRARSSTDGSTRLLYALIDEFLAERGLQLPAARDVTVGRRWNRVFPDQQTPPKQRTDS